MIRVQGSGYWVQGLAFRVQNSGYKVQDAGSRVKLTGHESHVLSKVTRCWYKEFVTAKQLTVLLHTDLRLLGLFPTLQRERKRSPYTPTRGGRVRLISGKFVWV